MTNPLTMKSWSPYVVGIGVGLLSWFAFAVAEQAIGAGGRNPHARVVPSELHAAAEDGSGNPAKNACCRDEEPGEVCGDR